MNTHGNVAFNAQAFRDWMRLTPDDVVLGVAPLFHITGLVAHIAVALLVPMPLVLGFRFDAADDARPGRAHGGRRSPSARSRRSSRCCATRARPTADLSSLRAAYSGGAPVAAAVVEAFEQHFGRLHPQRLRADRDDLALPPRAVLRARPGRPGVGRPLGRQCRSSTPFPDRRRRRAGAAGRRGRRDRGLWAAGRAGLLEPARGDAHALPDGELHTGDVGFMDAERVVLRRRPQEGPDQRRRLQGLAAGGRGRAVRARRRLGRPRWSGCRTSTAARR